MPLIRRRAVRTTPTELTTGSARRRHVEVRYGPRPGPGDGPIRTVEPPTPRSPERPCPGYERRRRDTARPSSAGRDARHPSRPRSPRDRPIATSGAGATSVIRGTTGDSRRRRRRDRPSRSVGPPRRAPVRFAPTAPGRRSVARPSGSPERHRGRRPGQRRRHWRRRLSRPSAARRAGRVTSATRPVGSRRPVTEPPGCW